MFCSQCGKEMDNTNAFCPNCGHPVANANPTPAEPQQAPNAYTENAPQEATVQYSYIPQPVESQKKSKKGLILAIVIPCAAVFTIIVILFASLIGNFGGKAELHEKLLRDWSRVESNDGTYYTLILDFDEDEIEYNFDSTYVDRTIATYDYEVISGDTIRVEGFGEVKVKFNDDETMMTFTPSITDTEPSQNWFNFD